MAGRIVIPSFMPARNADGVLLPGAQLSVYLNNTTQKAVVYSDAALSTPLTNPVLADASGIFPPIFSADGSVFSVSVSDALDVPLATFDNVSTSTVVQVDPGMLAPTVAQTVSAALNAAGILVADQGSGT